MKRRNIATFLRGGLGPLGLIKLFEDARRRMTVLGNVRYPPYSETLELSPEELQANGAYNIDTHEKHMEAAWSYFNKLDGLCKRSANRGKGKKAARGSLKIDSVKQLVLLAYEGRHSKCFRYLLTAGERNPSTRLYMMLRKLGRYWKCTLDLVRCVRSETFTGLFQNIEFCAIPRMPARSPIPPFSSAHPSPRENRLLEFLKSIGYSEVDLAGYCRETNQRVSEVEEEFKKLERKELYVHAEIGLIFFYAVHPEFSPAPQIGCSKHACFLCNIFIKHHPHFQIRDTHNKIYVGWGVPDLSGTIGNAQYPPYLQDTIRKTMQDMENAVRFGFLDSPKKKSPIFLPPDSSSGVSETVVGQEVEGSVMGSEIEGTVDLQDDGRRRVITQNEIRKMLGVSMDRYFNIDSDDLNDRFEEMEIIPDIPPTAITCKQRHFFLSSSIISRPVLSNYP